MKYLGKIGMAAMVLLAGCKNYSDDIDELNRRIDGLVGDLQTLSERIGDGPVKEVTFGDGILRVTTESGTVSYEIGAQTRVFEMKPDGTQVKINGAVVGDVPGISADSKLDMLADGTVTVDGNAQPFAVAPADELKKCVVFIYGADGNLTAVKVKDGATFIGIDLAQTLAPSITSVVHIPSAIDGLLGAVEYFPVIACDEYSVGPHSPVFAYNASGKTLHETFVPGWLTMNFRINPGNVDPSALLGYSFDHQAPYVMAKTRGTPPGLTVKPGAEIHDGSLAVQLRGLLMMKWSGNGDVIPGAQYDDPLGIESGTLLGQNFYQGDQLALQLVTRLANGQQGVVSSAYIYMKRLVVLQRDVAIGLTVAEDGTTPVANARPLADMYTDPVRGVPFTYSGGGVTPDPAAAPMSETEHTQRINAYKTDISPMLDISYAAFAGSNAYDLNGVVTGYFTRYHTNRGHDSSAGQYDFLKFGFDVPVRRYALEPYDDGTADPYYTAAKMTEYVSLTSDGRLSFVAGVPYAVGLEPAVRVDLVTGDGTVLTSKLLKVRIIQ